MVDSTWLGSIFCDLVAGDGSIAGFFSSSLVAFSGNEALAGAVMGPLDCAVVRGGDAGSAGILRGAI